MVEDSALQHNREAGGLIMATLGNTLYMIGCVASVPFLALAIYSAAALAGFFGATTDPAETEMFAEQMIAAAIASLVAGRMSRHFLAGT
jgi:hypothetical protein